MSTEQGPLTQMLEVREDFLEEELLNRDPKQNRSRSCEKSISMFQAEVTQHRGKKESNRILFLHIQFPSLLFSTYLFYPKSPYQIFLKT